MADVFLARGDNPGVGTSKAWGDSEALRFERDDVGFGRRAHSTERDAFGNRDDGERLCGARHLRDARYRLKYAKKIRRLHEHGADIVVHGRAEGGKINLARGREADFVDLQVDIARVSRQHLAVFGMHGTRHEHAATAREALSHENGFGCGCRAIPHGGVGDFLAGQLGHQGLKFEDGLQRALADFRLIGRVRGEEFTAQQDCVRNYGTQVVIDAGAQKTGVAQGIFGGALAEILDQLGLREGAGKIERPLEAQRFRNRRE